MAVFFDIGPEESKVESVDAPIGGSFGTGFLAFEEGVDQQRVGTLQAT